MNKQNKKPLAIHDVVFEQYKPMVENIVRQQVQHRVGQALTIVHNMIEEELIKAEAESNQSLKEGCQRILMRMQSTFMGNASNSTPKTKD